MPKTILGSKYLLNPLEKEGIQRYQLFESIIFLEHKNNYFQKIIVEDYDHSFEEHCVTTEDGYIITVHQIFNDHVKS